jgi:hypothetical protein
MTTTRATRTGRHLRLWVGLAVAIGVVFAPGLNTGEGLTLTAAGLTYVLGATLFDAIAARRPAFPARVLTPSSGWPRSSSSSWRSRVRSGPGSCCSCSS